MSEKHKFDGLCKHCGKPESDPIHDPIRSVPAAAPEEKKDHWPETQEFLHKLATEDEHDFAASSPAPVAPAAPVSEAPKAAPAQTPCCGYIWQAKGDPGPIFWNQYNRAVQCHNCGQVFVPPEASNGDSL